jgi:hypothetical protein
MESLKNHLLKRANEKTPNNKLRAAKFCIRQNKYMKQLKLFLLFLLVFPTFACAEADQAEWEKRTDALILEVCRSIKNECLVQFSAYSEDKNGLPVNNLNEIALKGKVIVIQKYDPFWGKGKDYTSKIVTNPTWRDLSIIANEMIHITGDKHHIYLEGFEIIKTEKGIKHIELYMGS